MEDVTLLGEETISSLALPVCNPAGPYNFLVCQSLYLAVWQVGGDDVCHIITAVVVMEITTVRFHQLLQIIWTWI